MPTKLDSPTRVWVSMTMPRELVERIDALAEEETRPRSQMIRRLLLQALQLHTEPVKPETV